MDPAHVLTRLLPPYDRSFVVLTDTHLVDPGTAHAGEFGSRLKQNDRLAVALELVTSLGMASAVHLGDLVQDYPDSQTHHPLLVTATEQIRRVAGQVHLVSGNTDVGDKPDPSSPAVIADAATVAGYAETTAPAWQSFTVAGMRGISLCSSILNGGSDLEEEQWRWLAEQFAVDTPTVLFWHHPLFLCDRDDPGVGHYDAIAEPARSRLLEVIEAHDVWGVFTGHSHFWFRTGLTGRAQGYGISSTSFTRPGFSELFSSAAPPDRGRDDVDKLGFTVVRVHPEGLRVHQVRSGTVSRLRLAGIEAHPVLTGTPRDCSAARLGVIARHPIAVWTEIPDVFPSVVRQPARDDHAWLGCLELGATAVSVTAGDVSDPRTNERLQLLRGEGVEVTVRMVRTGASETPLPAAEDVDRVEFVLLDTSRPSAADLAVLGSYAGAGCEIAISALHRTRTSTAELPRWRYGIPPADILDVTAILAEVGLSAVLLAADEDASVTAVDSEVTIERIHTLTGTSPAALWSLADRQLAAIAAGQRFWVDSLTELDRTLVTNPGLLDRMRNPQPTFHLVRILTTLCSVPCESVRDDNGWTIRRGDLTAELRRGWPAETGATGEVIDLGRGVQVGPGSATSTDGPFLLLTS